MCTWKLKVSRVLKRAIPERIIFVFHRLRIDERIILQDSQTNSCFWIFLILMSYWETTFLQKLASSWEQVPGTFLSYCTHAYSRDSRLLCWNFMFCVQKLWFVQCTGLEQVSHLHIAKTKGSMSFLSFGSRSFRPKTEHTSKFRGIFLLNNSYHLLSQLLMVLTLAENVLIRVDDAEIWQRRMLNRKTENKVS